MSSEKILIVEDESVVALDIEDALTASGYEVVGTEAWGEKAFERAQMLKPDLVLMDIRLKGVVDGIEACNQIKKALKIPVIFLTAHADEATLQRAKIATPDGYLLKPFEPQELRAVIELALYKGSHNGADSAAVSPQSSWNGEDLSIDSLEDRVHLLAKTPLFENLPEALRTELAEQATTRQVDAGTILWDESTNVGKAFLVLTGKAAFVKTSENGKEMIVELLAPGDILPMLFALNFDNSSTKPPFRARLQSPGQILEIPVTALRSLRHSDTDLARVSMHILLQRLNASYERARSLAHDPVENRICMTLRTLAPQFAKAYRGTAYSIYMTRQELADLTGTTTETAIRTTKNLERHGALDLSRPGIIRILDEHLLPS